MGLDKVFVVRVSALQMEQLRLEAKQAGKSVGWVVRRKLVVALDGVVECRKDD
jgi:predicted HicB family RNase H-like nuclease